MSATCSALLSTVRWEKRTDELFDQKFDIMTFYYAQFCCINTSCTMHTCHLQLIIHVDIKLATKACPLNGGGGAVDPKKPSAPHNGLYYCFDSCASNGVSNTEHE